MPGQMRAAEPEPHLLWFPLGVWAEKQLIGIVTYCVYSSLSLSPKLFRQSRRAEVRDLLRYLEQQGGGARPKIPDCPKGYSVWVDEIALGCMADVALVTDAARPMMWTLLAAGFSGLVLVLLRKARDAGVTLSLPWARRDAGLNARGEAIDRHGRTLMPHPAGPPAQRPLHQHIAWWLEGALVVLTGLSLLVFFDIAWTLFLQPWSVRCPDVPACPPSGSWLPDYVYQYSPRSRRCDRVWRMVLLALTYAFNALVAAAMNGLAVVLVQREIVHDGSPWA